MGPTWLYRPDHPHWFGHRRRHGGRGVSRGREVLYLYTISICMSQSRSILELAKRTKLQSWLSYSDRSSFCGCSSFFTVMTKRIVPTWMSGSKFHRPYSAELRKLSIYEPYLPTIWTTYNLTGAMSTILYTRCKLLYTVGSIESLEV